MKKEIYIAAASGDVEFMKEAGARDVEAVEAKYTENDFLEVSFQGDNIIHVAAQNGRLEFMKAALAFFSASPNTQMKLLCHTNTDGDTPLHLAATQHTFDIAEHLVTAYLQLRPNAGDGDGDDDEYKLCGIQNNKGNTPLHVALMNGGSSILVAAYLLGVAPQLASFVNHRNETPLHLAVDYDTQGAKISKRNVMQKLNSLGATLDYTECISEEDSLSVIKLLLETAPIACCLRDEDGMTPLRRAIFNRYISAITAIINYCPESVKICDTRGRNMFHYIRYSDVLDANYLPAISSLVDQQDEDGNTPLHMAIINSDYRMVEAMIKSNANFAIKNKQGNSPAALILSDSNSCLYKMKDEIKELHIKYFPGELLEAVRSSNWGYLLRKLEAAESNDKQFLSRIQTGGNIIHVAVKNCELDFDGEYLNCSSNDDEETYSSLQEEFIVEALKKFPILYCQTDSCGWTPLHLAMGKSIMKPGGKAFRTVLEHLRHLKDQPGFYPIPPWVVQTSEEGDTILHFAIKYSRFEFAEKLLELDSKLVGMINHYKATSLHTLCGYGGRSEKHEQNENRMIELIVEKDSKALYMYDVEGLTPLMKAVDTRRIRIATRILNCYPQSIYGDNPLNGKNVFHIMNLDIEWDLDFINILPRNRFLLLGRDFKGNIPLHIAIEQDRFGTVQVLMELFGEEPELYAVRNNDGKTPLDMLAKAQEVPRQFQDFLMSKKFKMPFGLEEVGSSIYGVRHSHMREYMGTVGVVAALLTTITFTAAFTVPGGYDQNRGTPIMAKKIAFQVFMLADVVGMCSSMMVLFCLLWFLNSGQVRREGLCLVDLSISLLQLSFFATLTAFMTGVYVTTFLDIPWLAIFTCLLCTIVLLLMRKRFILDLVVPMFDSIIITIKTLSCPLLFLSRYHHST